MKKTFTRCLPVILLLFSVAFAQDQKEKEKQQETEKKAAQLLGAIGKESDLLKLTINRLTVSSTVANLLWKYDEKQARNLIAKVAEEINTAQNSEDSEEESPEWQIQQIRNNLVGWLARKDAEFALKIFRQTRSAEVARLMTAKNIYRNGNDNNRIQNEINTENYLLTELAKQDPKQALSRAREILSKGFSSSLIDLIEKAKEKEPEEASRLADEVLQKLQTFDFSNDYNVRNFIVQFLSQFAPKTEPNNNNQSKFSVSESGLRSLADKYANFLLRYPQIENEYYLLTSFIPVMEKFSATRTNQLRQKESEIKQKQAKNNSWERLNQLSQNADADTIIAEAQNESPEMKRQYYASAINKLLSDNKIERARTIIASITDKKIRENAMQSLISDLIYKAINKGNLDEARSLTTQIYNKSGRLNFLIQIFNAAKPKDEKLAREILDEARSLLASSPENREEMYALFQLANAYAEISPETSLEMIEPTIVRLNELINASLLLNKFSYSNQFSRQDEISMPFFENSLNSFGFFLNPNVVTKLSLADFDRTKNLADSFQRQEARIFMRLKIVQAVLSQSNSNNQIEISSFEGE